MGEEYFAGHGQTMHCENEGLGEKRAASWSVEGTALPPVIRFPRFSNTTPTVGLQLCRSVGLKDGYRLISMLSHRHFC